MADRDQASIVRSKEKIESDTDGTCSLMLTGALIVFVGLLGHIVGVATPYWISEGGVDFGLWQWCSAQGCNTFLLIEAYLNGWFHAVQALCILGLVCAILSFVTAIVYTRSLSLRLVIVPGAMALAAGLSVGTGVLVYAAKEWSLARDLGWSFFLEAASSGLFLIGSFILLVGSAKARKNSQGYDVRFIKGELPG